MQWVLKRYRDNKYECIQASIQTHTGSFQIANMLSFDLLALCNVFSNIPMQLTNTPLQSRHHQLKTVASFRSRPPVETHVDKSDSISSREGNDHRRRVSDKELGEARADQKQQPISCLCCCQLVMPSVFIRQIGNYCVFPGSASSASEWVGKSD